MKWIRYILRQYTNAITGYQCLALHKKFLIQAVHASSGLKYSLCLRCSISYSFLPTCPQWGSSLCSCYPHFAECTRVLLKLSRSGRAFCFPVWELRHAGREVIKKKEKEKEKGLMYWTGIRLLPFLGFLIWNVRPVNLGIFVYSKCPYTQTYHDPAHAHLDHSVLFCSSGKGSLVLS